MYYQTGVLLVLIAGVCYGFIPIFSLYAYEEGLGVIDFNFYRFLVATIVFFLYLIARGIKIRLNRNQVFRLFILGGVLNLLQSIFFENLKAPLTAPPARKHFSTVHPRRLEQYTAGIDSGSTSTNVVILDSKQNIVSFSVLPTGVHVADSAEKALEDALKKAGLSKNQISRTVSTGYGRANIAFRKKDVTEITCHAVGAHFLNPAVRSVIDIGGQDSKIIRLNENGTVLRFVMNDKCAAGTGRFLEMMAQSLGLTLEEMSRCGLQWDEEITISSMCSVFAQSEVVSLIAEDKKLEDIVHGLNLSVASKVIALGGRARMEGEYMITGGVAKNTGVVRAIEEKLSSPVLVPDEPEICGALGAALIAAT
jgi:predicted CoA-substrate-specific enzyme activase